MTIKDVAALSGYAVGTVSRVLNGSPNVSDEARKKILAVVQANDFRLNNNAKHLKQQSSSGVAIIVKGTENMLFASIIERLQGRIKEKGFPVLVYYIDEDENEVEQAVQVCQERRPQGIMFLGSNMDNFQRRFSAIGIPCILVTNSAAELPFGNLSSVGTDDAAAADYAIEHLISLGHRQIGILGGRVSDEVNAASNRYDGCLRSFARHGMDFDPARQLASARFAMGSGYEAMEELLEKMPEITAVFAMSDVMALGAVRALRDHGRRVPEDISVMGFDGIELGSYVSPRLTTIRQHGERIADRSVALLLQQIDSFTPAVDEIVPFDLIPGESVKRLSPEEIPSK